MEPYRDINGDSGIAAYEIGSDYIKVQFKDGAVYLYTAASVGSAHIAEMQRLARSGDGLNAYINTHDDVKNGYASKS